MGAKKQIGTCDYTGTYENCCTGMYSPKGRRKQNLGEKEAKPTTSLKPLSYFLEAPNEDFMRIMD